MKILFSSQDLSEINFVESLLIKNEIRYFIKDEHMSNLLPHYTVALGGKKVAVNDEDYERAIEIIRNNLEEQETSSTIKPKVDDKKCPACGSADVEICNKYRTSIKSVVFAIFTFILFINVLSSNKRLKCNKCNHEWNIKNNVPGIIAVYAALVLFAILLIMQYVLSF